MPALSRTDGRRIAALFGPPTPPRTPRRGHHDGHQRGTTMAKALKSQRAESGGGGNRTPVRRLKPGSPRLPRSRQGCGIPTMASPIRTTSDPQFPVDLERFRNVRTGRASCPSPSPHGGNRDLGSPVIVAATTPAARAVVRRSGPVRAWLVFESPARIASPVWMRNAPVQCPQCSACRGGSRSPGHRVRGRGTRNRRRVTSCWATPRSSPRSTPPPWRAACNRPAAGTRARRCRAAARRCPSCT
jgi:hypothetical protein